MSFFQQGGALNQTGRIGKFIAMDGMLTRLMLLITTLLLRGSIGCYNSLTPSAKQG